MHGETFDKPPLVEIVAEVKWGSTSLTIPFEGPNQSVPAENTPDELYNRFESAIAENDYTGVERLIPQGMPVMSHQPVYRYKKRKTGQDSEQTLYQLGSGILSVHGIPPYKNWATFLPVLEAGINALSQARSGPDQTFASVTLRYIDVFSDSLMEGRSLAQFVENIFGISISLPEAITKHCTNRDAIKSALHLKVPTASGDTIAVTISEGRAGPHAGIVMDTAVQRLRETSVASVMTVFEEEHRVIHDMFIGMTRPIHTQMGLRETQ